MGSNLTTSLDATAVSRSEGAESTSDAQRPSTRPGYWTENRAYVIGWDLDERRAGQLTVEQQLFAIHEYAD